MSILAHGFEVHAEDGTGLAAPEGIVLVRHRALDDRDRSVAAFEVERPRERCKVLRGVAVDSSASDFDVLALRLGAGFGLGGLLGRRLRRGGGLGGGRFGHLGVFDGRRLPGPHCWSRGGEGAGL
jgi:hypothetical protein